MKILNLISIIFLQWIHHRAIFQTLLFFHQIYIQFQFHVLNKPNIIHLNKINCHLFCKSSINLQIFLNRIFLLSKHHQFEKNKISIFHALHHINIVLLIWYFRYHCTIYIFQMEYHCLHDFQQVYFHLHHNFSLNQQIFLTCNHHQKTLNHYLSI